jgi:hypothetical protein
MMLASLIVGVIAASICTAIAASKGRSVVGWALLGFLFGLFALIAIACLPALENQGYSYGLPRNDFYGTQQTQINWH